MHRLFMRNKYNIYFLSKTQTKGQKLGIEILKTEKRIFVWKRYTNVSHPNKRSPGKYRMMKITLFFYLSKCFSLSNILA